MLDIQEIGVIVTTFSVGIAAIYYIISVRNGNRTREAQLLMQVYSSYTTEEFHNDFTKIRMWSYRDYDEFLQKYGDSDSIAFMNHVASYFEGVGTLVYRGFLNPKLVDDLMSNYVFILWEKLGPFVLEARKRRNQPEIYDKTEYLYFKLMEIYAREHGFKFEGKPFLIK